MAGSTFQTNPFDLYKLLEEVGVRLAYVYLALNGTAIESCLHVCKPAPAGFLSYLKKGCRLFETENPFTQNY